MRHGLAAPRLDRQSGLGAVERLDLALLVNRQHHGVGRRVNPRVRPMVGPRAGSEPDDISQLGGEAWIARAFEGAQPVRCSLCARQMRCTEPTEMPIALAIARPVQWVAWCVLACT